MTNYEESLLNYLQPEEAEDKSFHVTNDAEAAWAVGKIKLYQDKLAKAQATAELQHKAIDNWLKNEKLSLEGSIAYFTEMLRPYALQGLEGTKSRTYKVYNGSMSFRKGSVSYDRDDAKLLTFVKENASDYIVTTEKVNWAEYKKTLTPVGDGKLITADGEIVEGVTYSQGDDVFTVKPLELEG